MKTNRIFSTLIVVGLLLYSVSCTKVQEQRPSEEQVVAIPKDIEAVDENLVELSIDDQVVVEFWDKDRTGSIYGGGPNNYIGTIYFYTNKEILIAYEGAGYYLKPVGIDFKKDVLEITFLRVWIGAGEVVRDQQRTITKIRAELAASELIERIRNENNLYFSAKDAVSVNFGVVGSMYPLQLNEGISLIDESILPLGSTKDSQIDVIDLVVLPDNKAVLKIEINGEVIETKELEIKD